MFRQKRHLYPITSGSIVIKENAHNSGKFFVKDLRSRKSGYANKDLINLLLLCNGHNNLHEILKNMTAIYIGSENSINKKIMDAFQYLERLGYVSFAEKSTYCPITFHKKYYKWSLDHVYLEITDYCNLSCLYCYAKTSSTIKKELKTEEVFKLIDILAKLGVLVITFTGGEPLLHKDIFKILQYTKYKNIDFNLYTNGFLLTKDVVKKLKSLSPKVVAVSLDSNIPEVHNKIAGKDCFSNVVNGLRLLQKEKIPLRINSTILKGLNDKEENIEKAIAFYNSFDAKQIAIGSVMKYGNGRKNSHFSLPISKEIELMKYIRRSSEKKHSKYYKKTVPILGSSTVFDNDIAPFYSNCGIGTSACTIRANGDVILCPVLREKKYCAGNIFKKSIDKIWVHSKIYDFCRTHTIDNISKCTNCSFKTICRERCIAKFLTLSGRFDSTEDKCPYSRELMNLYTNN